MTTSVLASRPTFPSASSYSSLLSTVFFSVSMYLSACRTRSSAGANVETFFTASAAHDGICTASAANAATNAATHRQRLFDILEFLQGDRSTGQGWGIMTVGERIPQN